jgi:hypothetical protein
MTDLKDAYFPLNINTVANYQRPTRMANDNSICQKMLTLLALTTVSVSLIVVSFGVALSHKTHKILQEATVAQLGTNQMAFRAVSCDMARCTGVKTVWKTLRQTTLAVSTVTETKVVYAPGRDGPTSSTVELEDPPILTLVSHAIPTEKADGAQEIRRQIVDVIKPEMQM